jgi:SEC-C motif-containing protein
MGDAPYLLSTWHPLVRPRTLQIDVGISWRRLDIVRTERGGMLDSEGTVEFIAHYRRDRVTRQQHEVSHFLKLDRCWYYEGALS